MKICPKCNKEYESGGFCEEDGAPLIEKLADFAPPSSVQKIMAGGDITQNISHHSETNVYNQDETKQVKQCAVSGRNAVVTEGATCSSCQQWALNDYFNAERQICQTCLQREFADKESSYRSIVIDFLGDDHVLDPEERKKLDQKADELGLSPQVKNRIESEERTKDAESVGEPMSPRDKSRYNRALNAFLKQGDPKSAFNYIEGLQTALPHNREVAELYVLIAVEADPAKGLSFIYQSPIFSGDSAIKSVRLIELHESMGNEKEASNEERNAHRGFGDNPLVQAKALERLIDLYYEDEQQQDQAEDVKAEAASFQKPEPEDDSYLHFVQAYLDNFLGNRESLAPLDEFDPARPFLLRKQRALKRKTNSVETDAESIQKIEKLIGQVDTNWEKSSEQNRENVYRRIFLEFIKNDSKIDSEERNILQEKGESLGLSREKILQIENDVRGSIEKSFLKSRSPEDLVRIKKAKKTLFKEGKFKEAYREIASLLESLPEDEEIFDLYIWAALTQDPGIALDSLKKSNFFSIDTPEKSFYLTDIYEALNKESKAIESLKKGMHLFPENRQLQYKQLERLIDQYFNDKQEDWQLENLKDYHKTIAGISNDDVTGSMLVYNEFLKLYYKLATDESSTAEDDLEKTSQNFFFLIKSNTRDVRKKYQAALLKRRKQEEARIEQERIAEERRREIEEEERLAEEQRKQEELVAEAEKLKIKKELERLRKERIKKVLIFSVIVLLTLLGYLYFFVSFSIDTTDSDGNRYIGEADLLSRYHGKGVFTYVSGETFKGEFRNGKHYKGLLTFPDGTSFEGEFRNGKKFKGEEKRPDGSILDGEWKNDQLVKGKVAYSNGESFSGEFKDGKLSKGIRVFSNGVRYEGSFSTEVKPHGSGKLFWPDGSSFDGKFVDGKPIKGIHKYLSGNRYEGTVNEFAQKHGKGKYFWPNGSSFDGEFLKDKPIKGTRLFESGNRYEGPVNENWLMHGKGKYFFASGGFLEAEFKNGKFSRGTRVYKTGTRYEGSFNSQEQKHGRGISFNKDGSSFDGEFRNDSMFKGKYLWPDGEFFVGEFRDGSVHQGTFVYADGSKYEGAWAKNVQNGNGKLTLSDGSWYEGTVIDGFVGGQGHYFEDGRKKEVSWDGKRMWKKGFFGGLKVVPAKYPSWLGGK